MKNNNLAHTQKVFKQTLLVSALLSALSATSLQAQEEDADEVDDGGMERIFVTASKRETGLQQTPIAVTVVAGEAIEQAKVLDITDLQILVPTLRVVPLQRSTNTTFSIRGFGNGANNAGIEPSVGIFIDGVYRSRAAAQIGDLPRLQQIEVLSGPQSTLFGKNASAGVINVRTEEPSYDQQGRVEAGIGNFNQRLYKGYYSNGITDNLAYSVSGSINTRDGFTDSLTGLGELNDRDRWNLRGQMLYEPTEDVTFRLIADYSEIEEVCCTTARPINGPADQAIAFLGGQSLNADDPFSYESVLNFDPVNNVEDSGISLQADIDFDGFTFTSITAFRNNESSYLTDVDFTSLDILTEEARTNIDTFTQEFRLTSTGTRTVDWMVGAFFFDEDLDNGDTLFYGNETRSYFDTLLAGGGAPGLLGSTEGVYGADPGTFFAPGRAITTDFNQQNQAYSVFVNLDYHISDKLTATLGMSFTNDEKQVSRVTDNVEAFSKIDLVNDNTAFGVPLPLTPLAPAIGTLQGLQFLPQRIDYPNAVEDGESSDSQTTWSARLAYEFNSNINFFATGATGFKASSWNLSRDSHPFASDTAALTTAGLVQPNQNFGTRLAAPEKAIVYELGMKARFQRGAFNITLFDQTIENFQSSIFVGTGFILLNAGEQSTKGVEFDSMYRVTDNLIFTFAGTLLDPTFDSFDVASGIDNVPINLTGTRPDGIHGTSLTAGITYNYDLGNGMFGYVRGDYIHESEETIAVNIPASLTREVNTFNASAGLNFDNGVNLQVYARNLTNDEFFMSGFPSPLQAGSFSVYPNQPRTVGISVSYEFF
jgi:outer membrane receptor protein involved in Fe transport